jgi:hypothetical protein
VVEERRNGGSDHYYSGPFTTIIGGGIDVGDEPALLYCAEPLLTDLVYCTGGVVNELTRTTLFVDVVDLLT